MPHEMIDARSIWPITLDCYEFEVLLGYEFLRNAVTHLVEFRSAVARFTDKHDTRLADAIEQGLRQFNGRKFASVETGSELEELFLELTAGASERGRVGFGVAGAKVDDGEESGS